MTSLTTNDDAGRGGAGSGPLPVPAPRVAIEIADATAADLDWIDDLQKRHSDRVGFHPRAALEGKVRLGQIIVARLVGDAPAERHEGTEAQRHEGAEEDRHEGTKAQRHEGANGAGASSSAPFVPSCLSAFVPSSSSRNLAAPVRVGYCMASDRYMKRDEVGIVYQVNVEPGHQRGFVGAALLKAQFERSAYGCRLYCCWCAQDLAANQFWEAMGFVPLAFRAGSEKRRRVHIFWQKRIRGGDDETPWWFPAQTQGGSMADRLVFPIPPGVHWSEVRPPEMPNGECPMPNGRRIAGTAVARAKVQREQARPAARGPLCGALQFGSPVVITDVAKAGGPAEKVKAKREKAKIDPRLVSAARELRDRWLERVNAGAIAAAIGKYDVTRGIEEAHGVAISRLPRAKRVALLEAA